MSVLNPDRWRLRLVTIFCGIGTLLSASPQRPTFRTGVQTVTIYATVSDREGRLVPDLKKEDFQILDNGRPVEATVFSNEIQTITVAVMLDMSGSMVGRFLRVRDATRHFIAALRPGDRARVGTFGDEIAVSPLLTGDRRELERVLLEELWPGGATPLWSAIDAAMTSLANEPGRRVVLTLTDGRDGWGRQRPPRTASLNDVKRRAVAESFMVYAIGFEGTGLDPGVLSLSEQTGGGHFEVKDTTELAPTFERVAEELRRQYAIGFTPAALDGKVHSLEIRLAEHGLKARGRRSYVAAPDRR